MAEFPYHLHYSFPSYRLIGKESSCFCELLYTIVWNNGLDKVWHQNLKAVFEQEGDILW